METRVTGHCQSLPEKYGFNLDATGCHPERPHGHASAADMNQGMAVNNRNPIQNLRNLLQTVQTYKLKNSETSKSSDSEAGSCGLSTTTTPAQSELESNGDFPKMEDRKPIFSFPPVSKLIFSLSNIPKTEKEQKCVTPSQSCSVTSVSSQLDYGKPKTLKLEKEFKYNIDHSTNCNPNLQNFPEVEYSDTTATYGTDTTSSPSSPPPRKLKTLGGDDNDSQNCAATSLEANVSHQFCESFTLTPPHSLTGSDTSPNDIPEDDETDCKITVTPANEELSSNFKKTDDIIGGQVSPILNDNQINNTNHTRASKDNQEHESVQNEDACEEMQTIIDDDLESLIEEIPLINLQVILERCDNIIPTRKPYNSEIKIEPQSPSSEFENESSEFPKMEQPVKTEQNMGFNFKVPSPVVKKRMKKQSLKVAKASLLQCSICHKSFISEATKKRHVLLYHTVRDRHYPCELCGKNFLSQPVLYDHLRRHFGEKPFQCEICKKRFVSSGELYVHKKRTHFKDLPYCCPTCSKRFLFRFELAQHFIKYKTHAKGNEI